MKISKIFCMIVTAYLSLTTLTVLADGWYERKGFYGDDDFYEYGLGRYGPYGYRGYRFDDDLLSFFSYQPSVALPSTPQVFIQQQEQPNKQQIAYWYYCRKTDSYYPYVKDCPDGWMRVVPHPSSP